MCLRERCRNWTASPSPTEFLDTWILIRPSLPHSATLNGQPDMRLTVRCAEWTETARTSAANRRGSRPRGLRPSSRSTLAVTTRTDCVGRSRRPAARPLGADVPMSATRISPAAVEAGLSAFRPIDITGHNAAFLTRRRARHVAGGVAGQTDFILTGASADQIRRQSMIDRGVSGRVLKHLHRRPPGRSSNIGLQQPQVRPDQLHSLGRHGTRGHNIRVTA